MGAIRSRIRTAPFMSSGWRELVASCAVASSVAASLAVQSGAVTWQELAAVVSLPSTVAATLSLAQWQELAASMAIPSSVIESFTLTQWQELAASVSVPSLVALTFGDTTPPTIVSASVDSLGTSITLTYSESLDAASVPATTAYSISAINSVVTGVSVPGGLTVVLTVSPPIQAGITTGVYYTPPGSGKIRDAAGNNAAALAYYICTNNSTVPLQDFYVSGTVYTATDGTDLAFSLDDTNTISYANLLFSDPNDPNHVGIFYYRALDGQIVGKLSTTGPQGPWTKTVGTAAVVGVTDEHRTICGWFGPDGIPCVVYGIHGQQMNYWRGSSTSDMLVTDGTKIFPMVAGQDTPEAASTYPQVSAAYVDKKTPFIYRTGGSGNGNHNFYLTSGATRTSVLSPFLGDDGSVSYYPNAAMETEGASSKHPDRTWLSFGLRETTDYLTSRNLWCIYSDDKGATWRSWNGTLLVTPLNEARLAPALVEAIPKASTSGGVHSDTANYFGFQGMSVGTDGVPTITHWYGPNVDGSGNLDFSAGMNLWAWRLVNGAWLKKKLSNWTIDMLATTRVRTVWKDGKLFIFYPLAKTSDAGANVARMAYTVAYGDAMDFPAERNVFVRNVDNDIGPTTSCNYDLNHWQQQIATAGVGPNFYWQKTAKTFNPGSNGPGVLISSISATIPSNPDPNTIFSNPDYWCRADSLVTIPTGAEVSAWGDKSTHGVSFAQAISGKRPQRVLNALKGQPSIRPDNVDDFLAATLARVAPGTTPFFLWFVMRQNTWTTGDQWYNDGGAGLFASTGSPSVRGFNGSNGTLNAGLTTSAGVGTWKLVMAQFRNTAADYLQIGSVVASGIMGNSAGTGTVGIFATGTGTSPSDFEMCEHGRFSGIASAQQKFDLQCYVGERYGFTLIT